jgi:hypothetical protein
MQARVTGRPFFLYAFFSGFVELNTPRLKNAAAKPGSVLCGAGPASLEIVSENLNSLYYHN